MIDEKLKFVTICCYGVTYWWGRVAHFGRSNLNCHRHFLFCQFASVLWSVLGSIDICHCHSIVFYQLPNWVNVCRNDTCCFWYCSSPFRCSLVLTTNYRKKVVKETQLETSFFSLKLQHRTTLCPLAKFFTICSLHIRRNTFTLMFSLFTLLLSSCPFHHISTTFD